MKAFVFIDRLGDELTPLSEQYCVAMMPIAGKPVVAYSIDELARLGVKQAVIIACRGAREIAEFLGHGERWGMKFEYFPSRGQERPGELLARYGTLPYEAFLVLRGDVLRSSSSAFMTMAKARQDRLLHCHIGGLDAGLCFCRDRDSVAQLSLPFTEGAMIETQYWIDLPGARYAALDSLADLHRANVELVSGAFEGLSLAGWQRRPGLVVGPGSHVEDSHPDAHHVYVGKSCRVHRKAELKGSVVIDDGSFIDRGARIEDSVILPGTYVGENLHVKNALISGQQIMRVDLGSNYRVTDPFLLSTMKTDAVWRLTKSLGNRLAGLIVLLLSLPLWPLACIIAMFNLPERLMYAKVYIGNKTGPDQANISRPSTFSGWHWNVEIPVLRYLPLSLAAVSGHINLWGACPRPETESEAEITPGQHAEKMTVGLLGPVQLVLPLDAPPEERMLSEMEYGYEQSVAQRLSYVRRALLALFTARAWRPTVAGPEGVSD